MTMAKKPEKPAMKPEMRPVQLLFTPEEHKALRMAAAAAEMPMTKFIHKMISEALEKK
jgi:uncharacterized protein (DUF1778 family)